MGKIRGVSNGKVLGTTTLKKGLNYGQFGPMSTGSQSIELLNWDSLSIGTGSASGTRCVSTTCPDTIYNLNPSVKALGGGVPGGCNSGHTYGQKTKTGAVGGGIFAELKSCDNPQGQEGLGWLSTTCTVPEIRLANTSRHKKLAASKAIDALKQVRQCHSDQHGPGNT